MTNKAGKLYLGREYDIQKGTVTNQPVQYDARHLTTHAVILGMTGSGKTGLGIIWLEEALLQGIPALILDPKGDIVNLLLTFPDLQPEDFVPWVDVEGARRQGMEVAEYAAEMAHKWQEGLASWDIAPDRIAQLRQTAQFTIFTPGSQAGQPVNVLNFFDTPDVDWEEHEEPLRERIGGIVSALLGLVGVEADPLQSPEHILLARIIEHVWRVGDSLDLPTLIRLLQKPPFQQVGVFELETFFPEKDRFALARSLNNLIAAPGFETWREGTSLDVSSLLFADDGRPRASIFYLAHLNDAQRMFFVTLFLEATRDWLRRQSGTTNLRALVYFDEVFGYFPPYPANPPSKAPLMALIKQGRAAGLGMILSTQNPADLDYKGLTNAGTWAIGALRAERDKQRVLEGLEGAIAEAGSNMDRQAVEKALGSLKSRVFLFHDIHAGPPVFFHTRWAMSYLAGPLTRKQVQMLAKEQTPVEETTVPVAAQSQVQSPLEEQPAPPPKSADRDTATFSQTPPALPPDIPQVFLSPTVAFEWAVRNYEEETGRTILTKEREIVYVPHLFARGMVRVVNQTRKVDHQEVVSRLLIPEEDALGVDWDAGEVDLPADVLSPKPAGKGRYAPVPGLLSRARDLKRLRKEFADYLYHNISTVIWQNPALKLYGQVGESRHEFRTRCEDEARRRRDEELKKEKAKIERRIARVEDRLRREERELAADQEELEARKREELLSLGESAFNLLTGRRSSAMVSRASRKRTLTTKAKADVEESLEAIEDFKQELEELETQWEEQAAEIRNRWADTVEEIEEFRVRPRRTDVRVDFCGIAWVPVWRVELEDGRQVNLPAISQPGDSDNRYLGKLALHGFEG